jgi:hypothetical protein
MSDCENGSRRECHDAGTVECPRCSDEFCSNCSQFMRGSCGLCRKLVLCGRCFGNYLWGMAQEGGYEEMGMDLICSDCEADTKHESNIEDLIREGQEEEEKRQSRLQASFCCPICDDAGDLFMGKCVTCESIVCHDCILEENCSDCRSLHAY